MIEQTLVDEFLNIETEDILYAIFETLLGKGGVRNFDSGYLETIEAH